MLLQEKNPIPPPPSNLLHGETIFTPVHIIEQLLRDKPELKQYSEAKNAKLVLHNLLLKLS